MKKIFKHSSITVILLYCFTFLSCNNEKKIDGIWQGMLKTEPTNEMMQMTFKSIDDQPDGGGKIEMKFFSKLNNLKLEYFPLPLSDANLDCQFNYTVKGHWYINSENLYITFKLSTLKIEVNEDDIDAKINEYYTGFQKYGKEASKIIQTEREHLIKFVKEKVTKSVIERYQQSKVKLVYRNLEMSGDKMSFDINDLGRITFHRVVASDSFNKEESSQKSTIEKSSNNDHQNVEPHLITVKSIDEDDFLKPQAGNTYEPTNMIDGDPSTAWAINLDKAYNNEGKIYGPTFYIECKKLSHIVIRNGYAKNETSYRNNSRALKMIFFKSELKSDVDDSAWYLYEGTLKDTPEEQVLHIDPDKSCNNGVYEVCMIFPVDGLRRGDKWNDLCISEIEFWGI